MATCECGCGQESARDFLPGHDQKLRTALETRVGGVLALRDLVDASASYASGQTSEQVFAQRVRSLMFRAASK
jgi:hypothetical protein